VSASTPTGAARAVVPPPGSHAERQQALAEIFGGSVVVKLGGRTQDDPALAAALAERWRQSAGRLVVVHGGGDAVSALQRARGVEPSFVGGRRVTTDADLDDVRMALSGLANKQLVARLLAAGVPALGLSGEDGALLQAAPGRDARLGRVGEPAHVNVPLLALLVGAGYCPVVSPVSTVADGHGVPRGQPLNVNGDDAAAAIAAAVGADELFFLADVPGVLVDGAPVDALEPEGCEALVAAGTVVGGMAAKLEAARAALAAGVARVRVGDLAALRDPARGTAIVPTLADAGPAVVRVVPGAG
jgi:acetylglutamate kinase